MICLNKHYIAEKIAKNTYKIDESGVANCYLLLGDDKALLIDTGCGAGNLKEAVSKLTHKPLIVAVTHRHPSCPVSMLTRPDAPLWQSTV